MRGVSPNNQAPVADAGPDLDVGEGTTVTLNGSGSYDPDGTIARYSWRQLSGPGVGLSDPTIQNPTFSAPRATADATLTFRLYVNDGDFGTSSVSVR